MAFPQRTIGGGFRDLATCEPTGIRMTRLRWINTDRYRPANRGRARSPSTAGNHGRPQASPIAIVDEHHDGNGGLRRLSEAIKRIGLADRRRTAGHRRAPLVDDVIWAGEAQKHRGPRAQ
jgi:hypothetical protein